MVRYVALKAREEGAVEERSEAEFGELRELALFGHRYRVSRRRENVEEGEGEKHRRHGDEADHVDRITGGADLPSLRRLLPSSSPPRIRQRSPRSVLSSRSEYQVPPAFSCILPLF